MKKVFLGAAALACVVGLGFVQAGPSRGHRVPSTNGDLGTVLSDMDALRGALTLEQSEALSAIQGEDLSGLLGELQRILTPEQMAVFESALQVGMVEEAYPQDPGVYLPYGCWSSSKVGLGLSLVGYIGCPGGVAKDATVAAWAASNFSGVCLIDQTTSCDSAVQAADVSAMGWETLLGSCSVADTAYYTALMTYRSCGGPKGGDETPTMTPFPDPTPTEGEPMPTPTEMPVPGTPPGN